MFTVFDEILIPNRHLTVKFCAEVVDYLLLTHAMLMDGSQEGGGHQDHHRRTENFIIII